MMVHGMAMPDSSLPGVPFAINNNGGVPIKVFGGPNGEYEVSTGETILINMQDTANADHEES